MIQSKNIVLESLEVEAIRIESMLSSLSNPPSARPLRECFSLYFKDLSSDIFLQLLKVFEARSEGTRDLTREHFNQSLYKALFAEEVFYPEDLKLIHEHFVALKEGVLRRHSGSGLCFFQEMQRYFQSISKQRFMQIHLPAESGQVLKLAEAKFHPLKEKYGITAGCVEAFTDFLLILASPRNSELAFLARNTVLFRHLYYNQYIANIIELYLSQGDEILLNCSSKAVCILVGFLACFLEKNSQEYKMLLTTFTGTGFLGRNLVLITSPVSKETASWNVFVLTQLIHQSDSLVAHICREHRFLASLLQVSYSYMEDGSPIQKTLRVELVNKFVKRASLLKCWDKALGGILNEYCGILFERTFRKALCQSQALLVLIIELILQNVLLNEVKLDDSALQVFVEMISPESKTTTRAKKAVFSFFMRSSLEQNVNFKAIKQNRKLIEVVKKCLLGTTQRLPALHLLLKITERGTSFLVSSELYKLLFRAEDGPQESHVVSKILRLMAKNINLLMFYLIQDEQLVPKSFLALSRNFCFEDKQLAEIHKVKTQTVNPALLCNLLQFIYGVLFYSHRLKLPQQYFLEQFEQAGVYRSFESFVKEGLVVGLHRDKKMLGNLVEQLPCFVLLSRIVSLLGLVGGEQKMGDVLLLKQMLIFKLADKSQTLRYKMTPRLRINLFIRTESGNFNTHFFMPFQVTKPELQRHISNNLGLPAVSLFVERDKELADESSFAEYKGKCIFEWSALELFVLPKDSKAKLCTLQYRQMAKLVKSEIKYQ